MDEQTKLEQLARLDAAIAHLTEIEDSGLLSGTLEGEAVTFRSADELRKTIASRKRQRCRLLASDSDAVDDGGFGTVDLSGCW